MMINISSTLIYVEFGEVKHYQTAFEMWKKLKEIYGGDENVKKSQS